MQHPELTAFVDHARERGLDPMAIRMLLLSAGWKERDIAQALSAQALQLPIPTPPDTGGARDAFLHLLTFAAFYTAAVSLIMLLFACIDQALPDPAMAERIRAEWVTNQMRRWMASLIVGLPLYLWLSRFLARELAAHPERAGSGVRRWLTYLTLFVAGTTLMFDLIALVFRLLQGELSLRFFLKVGILGVVAAASFVYYLRSLQLAPDKPAARRLHRGSAAVAASLALLALTWSMIQVGGPTTQRRRQFDERRVEDLRHIYAETLRLVLYNGDPVGRDAPGLIQGDDHTADLGKPQLTRPLPQSLDELARRAPTRRPNVEDPETGEPYGYEVLDDTRFRLCATFHFERDADETPRWNHPAGEHCFTIDVIDNSVR